MGSYTKSDAITGQRFKTELIGSQEWIVIPVPRHWFALPFLSIWLFFWTIGGFAAVSMLVTGPERLFIALWLVGWALGWVFAAATIAWQLRGQYRITAVEGALTYGWSMPFLSRTYIYDVHRIRELEPAKPFKLPLIGALPFRKPIFPPFIERLQFPQPRKTVTFRYDGKRTSLELGLREAEAQLVLDWLRERIAAHLNKGKGGGR